MYYFVDADDVIPDYIPGIGFLDDAIYAEIVIQELRTEIRLYQEFCQFRIAEETRRRDRGKDPYVGREDWITEKRSLLHSRMRKRRALRSGGRGWRMRLL
ncbi:MAG: YkvA family protein [Pseudohongiellaceae bacterium]